MGSDCISSSSLLIFLLYTRRNDNIEIYLTSISFQKAFETKSDDRLASYSVMQDKHALLSRSNRLT